MKKEEELIQLITRYQRPLMLYISSLVPRDAEAEEVLQEVNLVLWRRADEFRPGSDFGAWAYKIAHYQVMAYRQRKARDKLQFREELVARLAEEATNHGERNDLRRDALHECMKKLDEGDRELVRLRYDAGRGVAGIAATLGRSSPTVYRTLARIHHVLLECIKRRLSVEESA